MNPESDPHKVTTPYGPLYLAVMPATMDRFWDDGENVTALRPRIRVATDAAFEADPAAADHFTIRGRAYGVHRSFYYQANHHTGDPWQMENAPYRGGYRNDRRAPVEFSQKIWGVINDAVIAALDAFAKDHPEWAAFSEFLYWDRKEDAAWDEARHLTRQAEEKRIKAAEYRAKADAAQAAIDAARWRHDQAVKES